MGDKYDVQVNIHTDTLNESGFVESTPILCTPFVEKNDPRFLKVLLKPLEAERSILIIPKAQVRAFKSCLALYFLNIKHFVTGGGHAPDIIVVCEQDNVLPSSTNPTRPYTSNTLDEHLDVCNCNPNYPHTVTLERVLHF